MVAEYRGNDRRVVIDDQTAVWCARMLVGEGWKGDKGSAVLYSTLFRFLGMPHKWPDYQTMIRLFSQPINARWNPGGDLYEKYKTSDDPVYKAATSDKAVKRRFKIQSMKWNQIPKGVKALVNSFSRGQLAIPHQFGDEKFSNFASWEGVKTLHPAGVDIGGDWFFVDPKLKKNFEVQIANVGNYDLSKKPQPRTGFAFGVLLLMAAYWLMKKGKMT